MEIFKFAEKYYLLSVAGHNCSNCGNLKTDNINKIYYCWVCGESKNKNINYRQNILKYLTL